MKKLLLCLAIFLPLLSFAQNEDAKTKEITKFEKFVSKKGSIIKYSEYYLDDLSGTSGHGLLKLKYSVSAKVRKVTIDSVSDYYLNLSYQRNSGSECSTFISYNDIKELGRALDELVKRSSTEDIGIANYIENKFVTDDYLELGYYISINKKKDYKRYDDDGTDKEKKVLSDINWYIDLDTRYDNSMIFFSDYTSLKKCFDNAIMKIDELKAH